MIVGSVYPTQLALLAMPACLPPPRSILGVLFPNKCFNFYSTIHKDSFQQGDNGEQWTNHLSWLICWFE